MVSVLHISDLHLTENTCWDTMKRSILSYAEKTFHDIPVGEKLLIVTGDFHTYNMQGMLNPYELAEDFLKKLITRMGIEPTEDVFVVPGNHDVSASPSNYDRFFVVKALKEEESYRNKLNEKGKFYDYAMTTLLEYYEPYLKFINSMNIYSPFSDGYFPVRVHVRTWRNRLHILHLNTTLIADGKEKTSQLVDALTATSDRILDELRDKNLPCIAIGHNSYMDLDKQLQTESMRSAFYFGNISAYLCGDRHKLTEEPQDRLIYLKKDGSLPIDNIVVPRGSADRGDKYSDFGMLIHQWDERTGTVTCTSYLWKPNDTEVHPGSSLQYKFRDDNPPK